MYINKATRVILAMWVDDFIIFSENTALINDLKATLRDEFEMKDLGDLNYFLGIQVNRDKDRKLIHIHQTGYTNMILDKYRMQNSVPARTPLSAGTKLVKTSTGDVLADQVVLLEHCRKSNARNASDTTRSCSTSGPIGTLPSTSPEKS